MRRNATWPPLIAAPAGASGSGRRPWRSRCATSASWTCAPSTSTTPLTGSRRIGDEESPASDAVGSPTVLNAREMTIARQILKEIEERLRFLADIGLDYLTLDRTAQTLSGGEAQRIRLATQIGSGLTGVLYVCDEPTVGLHPVDDIRLIEDPEAPPGAWKHGGGGGA